MTVRDYSDAEKAAFVEKLAAGRAQAERERQLGLRPTRAEARRSALASVEQQIDQLGAEHRKADVARRVEILRELQALGVERFRLKYGGES